MSSEPPADVEGLWADLIARLRTTTVVVKPLADGCSAGVVPLSSASELRVYLDYLSAKADRIPPGTFRRLAKGQIVELPIGTSELIFEEFIDTDDIEIVERAEGRAATGTEGEAARGASGEEPAYLKWGCHRDTGWIEVTVGVLGSIKAMRSLSPSLTIAREGVLSVEEKFMGGTGVNITPPPSPPLGRVEPGAVIRTKKLIGRVADLLEICGYARIDAFMNRRSGDIIVIEANTLPGLTPSTVLFHQALQEQPPLFPRDLLETIINLGLSANIPTAPDGSVSASDSTDIRDAQG